jgi:serpin B
MKKIVFFLGLVLLSAACEKEEMSMGMAEGIDPYARGKSISLTRAEQDMTLSANNFAFDLFAQIRKERKGASVLLSPFSASMALSMAATGAEGETERQMRAVLGFESIAKEEMGEYFSKMVSGLMKADPHVTLRIANSIWMDKLFPVKEAFIQHAKETFSSTVAARDFLLPATLTEINDWVAEQTDDTIKELLDKLDPNIKMMLLNALSFDGKWRYVFSGTKKGSFTDADGKTRKADMMYATGELLYADKEGYELLCLPYGTGAFSLYVVLPPAGTDFAEAPFDRALWEGLLSSLRTCDVHVTLPSFVFRDSHNLVDPLRALGMELPFQTAADFSAITDIPVCIGKVDQKTFIEVNEKGTKATAATAVQLMVTSAGPDAPGDVPEYESVDFTADRPFFYLIRESSTGTLLYIGQAGSL